MSENLYNLLVKADTALRMGDRRVAGVLLHKILLQDITNHQAWRLLHSMFGGGQSLEEFQQAFSQRYYPQFAHLFRQEPLPKPLVPEPEPTPQAPELKPEPTISEPEPATSGSAAVAAGSGQLPQSSMVQEAAVNFWIDGKKQDPIMVNQERLFSLPAGRHTFRAKSANRAAQPIKVEIKPYTQVRVLCQPAATFATGVNPGLKLTLFLEAPLLRPDKLGAHELWSILRVFLLLLLGSAFVVWVAYIAYYMATN